MDFKGDEVFDEAIIQRFYKNVLVKGNLLTKFWQYFSLSGVGVKLFRETYRGFQGGTVSA